MLTAFGENVLEIKDKAIRVTEADCKDKWCMHQGAISRAGQTLACLPHRLTVTIEGEGEFDAVSK